jgi:O-antigen ligase
MAILVITSLCLLMAGWRPILSIAGILLGVFVLLQSQSGTAALSVAIAITVVPLAVFYRRGLTAFAFSCGVVIVALTLALWFVEESGIDIVQVVLTGLDKDETLSGRTILWDFGVEAYESRPWLGFGYKGYWEGAGTTSSILRFVLGQHLWFFHNNFVEVAVAFGFMGPIILGLGLFVGHYRVIRAYILDPQYTRLFAILVMVHILAFCFAENPLFSNHGFYQLLFIVAAASAVGYGVPRRRDG